MKLTDPQISVAIDILRSGKAILSKESSSDYVVAASPDLTQELRAGLDGVTPGPWRVFETRQSRIANQTHVGPYPRGVAHITSWGTDEPRASNAAHIARCSPENIRALLDALAAKDIVLAEARAEHSASRQNFHTMQHAANALLKRAEAAEASLADLAAENERLRKALEPFAEVVRRYDAAAKGFNVEPRPDSYKPRTEFTYGHLRNAARALQDEAGKK